MKFKNIKEIMQALLDGKIINHGSQSSSEFYFLSECGNIKNNNGDVCNPSFAYPESWQIHEEPKKKVKLYKFASKIGKTDHWTESDFFLKDEIDFIKFYGTKPFIMRLENTMIEVEE